MVDHQCEFDNGFVHWRMVDQEQLGRELCRRLEHPQPANGEFGGRLEHQERPDGICLWRLAHPEQRDAELLRRLAD